MSTEPATLSDFATQRTAADRRRERKQVILQEGRVYGTSQTQEHERTPTRVCLCCGSELAPNLARVIGDNNGNVAACSNCWVSTDGHEYDETSRAARQYRAGIGERHPDYRGGRQ